MPDQNVLLVDVAERVATVTLNRPEARNALNRALRRELYRSLRALDADEAVDVIVLTGADPAFCAGIDLKELGAGEAPDDPLAGAATAETAGEAAGPGDASATEEAPLTNSPFPPMTKPVIGAINGPAITGGFEVALQCDFLVASERARFADTHARVGIMPGWGLTVLLPEAIGLRRAREMSTTGNFIDAATALTWGLVNHVVPHDELLPFARRLAADIVSNDQRGVLRMLRTYDEGSRLTGAEAWELEARVSRQWQAETLDPAEIEARRAAVVARGRAQTR
ncbi:MAG TPA: enoyl-CoA hydratase [Acidimicrobiales bacterium]